GLDLLFESGRQSVLHHYFVSRRAFELWREFLHHSLEAIRAHHMNFGGIGSPRLSQNKNESKDAQGDQADAFHRVLPLLSRFNLEQRARLFVGEQIQKSVRSLTHVADALMENHQQRFEALLAFIVEDDSLDVAGSRNASDSHRTYEEIVFPRRELISRVERQAGCRDRRNPKHRR